MTLIYIMKLTTFAIIPTTLMLYASAYGADSVVKSVARPANEVLLTLDSGQLELRPLNDGAIRVRFSDGKTAEIPSLVLQGNISAPKFTVRDDKNTVTVATAKMQAVVDRATGAVSFRDAAGKNFLAETPGARLLTPSAVRGQPTFVVGQSFESPADEKLFGLGQYQDGLWDWRGLPIELR